MKTVLLFLSVILNDGTTYVNDVDNVSFKTVSDCNAYKKKMGYTSSNHLVFTCRTK